MSIIKFVFIGPESTGKTTLCEFLSKKYSTIWLNEICRTYAEDRIKNIDKNIKSEDINFNFSYNDFKEMAEKHNKIEYEITKKANKILFCDNDTFSLSIWCERYLGKYEKEIYDIYINAKNLENENKIYILTKPNVPFVQDGLRDGEHIREWMYKRFIEELDNKKMRYYILDSENYEERKEKAIKIINFYISTKE
jgi:HTH-type transcriptional repressor of NAD biosynthesis genes